MGRMAEIDGSEHSLPVSHISSTVRLRRQLKARLDWFEVAICVESRARSQVTQSRLTLAMSSAIRAERSGMPE